MLSQGGLPWLSLFNRYIGALIGFSSLLVDFWCIFGLGHNHHGGTNHATVQQVALLHHGNHAVRLSIWRGHHRHRLVLLRIERVTHRVHLFNVEFLEAVHEQAQSHFHAFANGANQLTRIFMSFSTFHCLFKAVRHRKKLFHKLFQSELVGLFHINFGSTTHILHLSLGPQRLVLVFLQLRLQQFQFGTFFSTGRAHV